MMSSVLWSCCNLLTLRSADTQLAGLETAGSRCCQSLHSERLHQWDALSVPNQVPFRAGDQGKRGLPCD